MTSDETEIPGLEYVIVYFEGEVAIQPTLEEALAAIFGESPPTLEEPPTVSQARSRTPPEGTLTEQVGLAADARPPSCSTRPTPRSRDERPRHLRREDGRGPRAKVDQAERLIEDAGDAPPDEATTTTTTDGASA